ncbi:hypothetical protein Asp14428_30540 [Actinoplanes sp. NBRC 14428]|nr:hypothetical protein Asp14428_30540 [Actinoplanes sp. NBRC 14428]
MRPVSLPEVAYGATAVRPHWGDLPLTLRTAIEDRFGARVTAATTAGGGFTRSFAAVVETSAGERAFLKAAPHSQAHAYAREAVITSALPPEVPAPRPRWTLTTEDHFVLCLDAIDGRMPGLPWTPEDLAAALHAWRVTADALATPLAAGRPTTGLLPTSGPGTPTAPATPDQPARPSGPATPSGPARSTEPVTAGEPATSTGPVTAGGAATSTGPITAGGVGRSSGPRAPGWAEVFDGPAGRGALAVPGGLSALGGLPTLSGIVRSELSWWSEVAGGRAPLPPAPPWVPARLEELAALEQALPELVAGTGMLHGDLRIDNIMIDTYGKAWLCDWSWPCLGAPWFDTVTLLVTAYASGLDVDLLLEPWAAPGAGVDGVLAAMGGYWLTRAAAGPSSASPHSRQHQRFSGEQALAWLASRRGWHRR